MENFNSKVCYPWIPTTSGVGDIDYAIANGALNVTINNPGGLSRGGEDRRDCRLLHKNLKMKAGDTYRLSYKIYASKAGRFYTCIKIIQVQPLALPTLVKYGTTMVR